jgi:hypothetical protein
MDFDQLINSLDVQTAHWVEAVLTNDETASDEELLNILCEKAFSQKKKRNYWYRNEASI